MRERHDSKESHDNGQRGQSHHDSSAPYGRRGHDRSHQQTAGAPEGTELGRETEASIGVAHTDARHEREPDAEVVAMRDDFVAESIKLAVQFH